VEVVGTLGSICKEGAILHERDSAFAHRVTTTSDPAEWPNIHIIREPARVSDVEFTLRVVWTEHARRELEGMQDQERFGGDAKGWHEHKVHEHAKQHMPEATRAKIRKPMHTGGQDPTKPEHITVTYKRDNKDLGVAHILANTS